MARGTAAVVDTERETLRADALPLETWAPTAGTMYVRITPTSVTGRIFARRP